MSSPPSRLCLILPPHGRRFYCVRRRPRTLPHFWQCVNPSEELTFRQKQDWELLLSARGIPYRLERHQGKEYLYVPPLCKQLAHEEWTAFSQETAQQHAVKPHPPAHPHAGWTALLPLLLILWHGWRVGWWPCPSLLPDPALWTDLGELSSVRLAVQQQFYRCITALTLHQDSPHLWGNVLFSLIFLPILARATGLGRAILLAVVGGVMGNFLNYFFRSAAFSSIGFSTAVFATLGAISGQATLFRQKGALLPLAAGMALMSLLGTGDERVDYLAHCCGFASGFVLGLSNAWLTRCAIPFFSQTGSALLALLLLLAGWWQAFF